jgi:hypothetical protein
MILTTPKTLIIDWSECPDYIRDDIKTRYSFGNDRYIAFYPEISTLEHFKFAYQDSQTEQRFEGSFEEFCKEFPLESWLIDQKINLKDFELILIKICW